MLRRVSHPVHYIYIYRCATVRDIRCAQRHMSEIILSSLSLTGLQMSDRCECGLLIVVIYFLMRNASDFFFHPLDARFNCLVMTKRDI